MLYPTVSARLLLLDRSVNLIDEGFDARAPHRPSRELVHDRRAGSAKCAAWWWLLPRYLQQNPRIEAPGDLAKHQIITMAHLPNSWTFPPVAGIIRPAHRSGDAAARHQQHPRRGGFGQSAGAASRCSFPTRWLEQVRNGELEVVLAGREPPALPVHVIVPQGRLTVPKVRAFIDFAVPGCAAICAGREDPGAQDGWKRSDTHQSQPVTVMCFARGPTHQQLCGVDRVSLRSPRLRFRPQ